MTDFAKFNDLMYQKEKEAGLVRMAAGYAWDWINKNDKTGYDILFLVMKLAMILMKKVL